MRYSKVHIEAMGYELPPVVVTSGELEGRLGPMYETLRISPGQLELMTGITERRWWNEGFMLSDGAAAAAKKALAKSGVKAREIETLIYAGVCRENFEPATACAVAAKVGVAPNAFVYDISNACLGVLNGIIDVANRIELGQIKAGMVVSCETAREINELTIGRMLANPTMGMFTQGLATLTGGSGAVAVILVHESLLKERGSRGGDGAGARRLLGGVAHAAPEHHALCRWGIAREGEPMGPAGEVFMATDSVSVLKHGVELGTRTWRDLMRTLEWSPERVDRIICHQVGSGHRSSILKLIEIPAEKDFSTFSYLGNIGTVSLPITAALAEQRGFLKAGSGERVAFLGIGSGLNCVMLGWEW